MTGARLLSPGHRAIVDAYLAARCLEHDHLVVALSGAHAYGFPSPDSDVDLKGVHVAPLPSIVGLWSPPAAVGGIEVVDGLEVDYGSNEIAQVLGGVLRGDGNFVERLLGPSALVVSPALSSVRPVVRANLSRRLHHHYRGFAHAQRKQADATRGAKKVLYVLRTALTGVHVLETGEIVTDLPTLAADRDVDVAEWIEAKQAAEGAVLAEGAYARAVSAMDDVFARLEAALRRSTLPADPPAPDELHHWLVGYRLRR